MTNHQLKAHCENVIANPEDYLDWVVDMARVVLASLEAVPRGWLTWHAIPPTWSEPGGGGEYLTFHESKPEGGSDDGTDSWPVYDAPPVAELKPIKLPEIIHVRESGFIGYVYDANEIEEALKRNGIEVES